MHSYAVQLELAHRFDPEAIRFELAGAHQHRLAELQLSVIEVASGRVRVALTLPAADLWTAVLSCMSLVDHTRYEISSFSAHS